MCTLASEEEMRGIKRYFWAILSGVLYGAAPVMILDIAAQGAATSSGCLMLRYGTTSILLLPFALHYGKGRRLCRRQLWEAAAAGVLMALTVSCVYTSYRWLPAGTGMAISYLYPLLIVQARRWLDHKKPGGFIAAAEGLFLAGMLLICDISLLPRGAWLGVGFALLSAFSYAGMLLWEEKRNLGTIHPIIFTELLSVTCTCCLGCFNLATGQFWFVPSVSALLRFVLVGAVGAMATATQLVAVKDCGAMCASLLGTLELVVCCLGSSLVLREAFNLRTITGTALVLIAVILVTVQDNRRMEAKETESGGAVQG